MKIKKIKNIDKILWILVFSALIGLIGISINAQPVKLKDNETSYAEETVNSYVNSSDFNMTNYALEVVPVAFFMNEKRLVDVFLIPENQTEGPIRFIVDLNSGEVIKKFIKPKPKVFRRSMQDMSRVRDAFMIANNDSEIKRNFALMDFKKIPHMQPYNGNNFHITFMPMDFCVMSGPGLLPPPPEFKKNQNLTLVDVNVSLKDRKVLGFGVRHFFAEGYGRPNSENCTFPEFAERHRYCKGENCTLA